MRARVYAYTPKPEVEIMMRNKKELKGFLLTATRLVVLALCFVTVFAVALTSDFVGTIGEGGIAFAERITQNINGESTYGKANPILPDQGAITVDNFNFPGGTSSWSYTATYYNVVPYYNTNDDKDTNNNTEIYKNSGNTDLFLGLGVAGTWDGGVTDGQAKNELSMVLNFDTSGFINEVLDIGLFDVTATITGNFQMNDQCDTIYTSAVAGPSVLTGQKAYQLRNNGDSAYSYDFDSNSSNVLNHSRSVTLTSTNRNLALAFDVYYPYKAGFTGRERYMNMNHISITFKISVKSDAKDGAAPIVANSLPGLENSYVKGVSGSGYAPYITSKDDASAFPVYFDSIKNYLKTDKVTDGTGSLASYTNSAIDKINGKNYYKFAQTEYVDMFNRTDSTFDDLIEQVTGGGTIDADTLSKIGAGDKVLSISGSNYSWSNASKDHYVNASGIKTVKVGDTVFDIYNSSGNAYGSQTEEVKISDTDGNVQSVGYATVTRTNRSRVVVSIYFTANGTVQTEVTDYSGLMATTRLTVSGIDTSLDDNGTPISDNDYLKATNTGEWLYDNLLEVGSAIDINEDTSAANYSPRVWFFTAKRADELSGLGSAHVFSSIAELLASGLNPIGIGDGFTFNYNFADGKAKSFGSDVYDAIGTLGADGKVTSESNAKGHGYYLFTFYTIDLAGNMSAVSSSYYAKVDFDTPDYNVDLSYILNSDGSKHTIYASQNGTWAKGATTLDIILSALGFSGNTLVFEDATGYHLFTLENAIVDGKYTSKLASYYNSLTANTDAVSDNTTTISLETEGARVNVTVTYIFDEAAGKGTLRFAVDTASIEWITDFTLFTGVFNTIDDRDFHGGKSYVNASWVGGVKVLIDTEAPVAPEFVSGDDTPFSKDFEGNYDVLPAYGDRVWYTGAYDKYVADIDFTDVFLSSSYRSDIKVYYGIKVVKNLTELGALGEKSIESEYMNITDNSLGYFDRLQYIGGDNLSDGGSTVIENGAMNIVPGGGAGMRVIYVWAVDQAGNVSEIKSYYVLADNTSYTLNAKVGKNSVEDSAASIVSVDAEGNPLTKFTRGEIATLNTTLGDDFVPFALTLTTNGVANKLLFNYMPSRDWTLAEENNGDYIGFSSVDALRFAIDDKDNLGMLDNSKTLAIEFAYRKVVDYTVTNSTVAYNSRPISVEMTFTDANSQSGFGYRFFDKDGTMLSSAPINPGEYFVEIYIDKNNQNYVTADFTMDEEGNQTFEKIAVTVIKGRIVISAEATSAQYGTDLDGVLKYSVSGIALEDMAGEGITEDMLALALDVAGYNSKGFYSVGYYNVVLKDNAILDGVANYDITFQSALHTVTQRVINVYTQSASKFYGDADPMFKFGVKESDLAFNTTKTAADLLAEIFDSASYVSAGSVDGFYLFEAGDRITRDKGEDAWTYQFSSNASLFDVNSNYRITIQKQGDFTINKRQVKIDVSGQFSVVKSGVTPSSDGIVPSYTLDAKDAFLADVIDALLQGKLSLATSGSAWSDYDSTKYEGATGFEILLAAISDRNIEITLKNAENYVIFIARAGTVIVKAKAEFNVTFGFKWADGEIKYSVENFTFECDDESVDFDDISWEAIVSSGDEYIAAGKYVVSFANAKLLKNGVEVDGTYVNVEPAILNVAPAKVEIRPTASTFSKVYGDADTVYGIEYEIVKVNGSAIAKDGTYAGLTYAELLGSVSGSFARARYHKDGGFSAYGTRYDDVLVNDMYYYGYIVNKAFAIDNNNLVADATVDGEYQNARFEITPKAIVLHTAGLVGVSKYYNGNNKVDYDKAGVNMYDVTDQLALATDSVKLVANDMYYNQVGDGKTDVAAHIVLGGFALQGAQSHNYTLAYIVNDGHTSIKVVGDKDGENFVIDGTTVEIVYIDNSDVSGAKSDYIYIMFKRAGVTKNDISIVKEYDNTNALSVDNVIIANSETDYASTAMLVGATNKQLIVEESGVFSGVKAGDGYLISRVKIVFTFENGISQGSVYDYDDSDVDISVNEANGTIELTVRNVKATIAKKQLKASSFESITPVGRDYNSTTAVDIRYTFADGALVVGDTVDSVGLRLAGSADGKDFGQHQVVIAQDGTSVSNANYAVDVNDINNAYSGLTVEITKARLMPNVSFADKVYDGTANVNVTKKAGTDFTTLYYADNLKDELAHITMSGTVSYVLSYAGVADANVAVDADGNEIKHNVLVSGLVINADDASILKNYRIYGSVYNKSEYMAFENADNGAIDDYEILQAVNVSKKNVVLMSQDFQIDAKVYDGSADATITIEVPVDDGKREGVLPEHKDMLEITANGVFASAKVGKNIRVKVTAPELALKKGIISNIINNYYLDYTAAFANEIIGTIVAKPVTVDVSLGERVYTGYSDIVKNKIKYTFDGIVDRDRNNYSIATTGGAFFIDKNVVLDAEGNVDFKQGNVYNPTLTNIGGFDINYVLAEKTSVKQDGRTLLGYEDESGVHYYQTPASDEGVIAYYYELRTVSKYVDDEDKESAKGYIVGRYKVDGAEVYLVSDDYTGASKSLASTMTYLTGSGKITQRGVYITANSIAKLDNAVADKMFNKTYDGTTKFYGTLEGTNAATDAFKYTDNGIANVIKGDDVHIASVSTEYNSAYTNAMYVVFTASGIAGADAHNYTIENKGSGASSDTYSAKLSAKILKRAINASLEDGETVYGTALGNVGGKVNYSVKDSANNTYALTWNASHKSFFIATSDFMNVAGLESGDTANSKYLEQIYAKTYNLVDGQYVKAESGTVGEFFRMGGETGDSISALPKPSTRFNSNKPNAGEVSNSYYLDGGNANNFGFVFEYTGNGKDGTSKLVVVKRTLYVTTAGINHVKTYAGTDPAVDLLFDGIASGDGLNIFVDGRGVDYRPIVVLAVYNSKTGEYTIADKYAKTSDKLDENEYYVYYLALPSGLTSYADFAPISNYNVVIGDSATLKAIASTDESGNTIKDANGKDVYEFVYSFGSGENVVTKKASTITIKLPTIDGVSVDSTNNKFTYTYDSEQHKGVNRVYDMLKGAKPDDVVTYVAENGEVKEARDAGTHTGYIYVRRFVKVDEGDTNGYYVEWKSSEVVTIVIERASAQLKGAAAYSYYNAKVQSYPINSVRYAAEQNGTDPGLWPEHYEMSYKIYKNGQYQDVAPSEIKSAGTYVVTISFTDAFEATFTNYKKETIETKFVINQVVVNVAINETGYNATVEQQDNASVKKLKAVYDPDRDYTINYTVSMGNGYSEGNSAIEISKADTKVTFATGANGEEKQVVGAGKYSFTVSIVNADIAGNYALVGNAGVLELTANAFNSDAGSVNIDGEGIVANRLVVRDITDSIVASDINYVAIIKQFMPALSSKANLSYDARVAAVVKTELYCDNQLVVIDGETTKVTVAIPSTVKSMKGIALYTVTREGNLRKLTDYTVKDGKIEYTTDYVSALVFVDVNPPTLAPWEIGVIVGSILVVVIIVTACVVGVVVRKKKLQKLI